MAIDIAEKADTSAAVAGEKYTTGTVTSKDGTTIGYRRLGHGPGVILLHGAMESAQSHMQLAEALADTFTVYLPDRRGRGLSGPYGKDHTSQEDVDDMDALLTMSGAHCVFGISSGALVWLQAALTLQAIHKAALYEPPLFINGSPSMAFLSRYDKEIADGRVASALTTGMIGAQMGPPIFNAVPRWALERLTTMMLKSEDKKAGSGDVTMRMLAPTLHYDFQSAADMSNNLESLSDIQADVLLLGGSKSPAYLKVALGVLEKIVPNVRRIEFSGLGHGGSGNSDRGGQPERVAQELRLFFA